MHGTILLLLNLDNGYSPEMFSFHSEGRNYKKS